MNINLEINVDFVFVLRAESLLNDEKGSRTEMCILAQPNDSPRISAIQ